jgi:hypothetical protein
LQSVKISSSLPAIVQALKTMLASVISYRNKGRTFCSLAGLRTNRHHERSRRKNILNQTLHERIGLEGQCSVCSLSQDEQGARAYRNHGRVSYRVRRSCHLLVTFCSTMKCAIRRAGRKEGITTKATGLYWILIRKAVRLRYRQGRCMGENMLTGASSLMRGLILDMIVT